MDWIKDLKAVNMLESFRIFKERIENIANRKMKYFRTDGGTEYKAVFSDFLLTQRIENKQGARIGSIFRLVQKELIEQC